MRGLGKSRMIFVTRYRVRSALIRLSDERIGPSRVTRHVLSVTMRSVTAARAPEAISSWTSKRG